jgi:hypothetical protein
MRRPHCFSGPGFYTTATIANTWSRVFLSVIRYAKDVVYLSCYFPMPFFQSAAIRLLGDGHTTVPGVRWRVGYEPFRGAPNEVGYFHATYKDFPTPEKGKDMVLLDTTKTEGGGEWSGNFVGTSFIFSHDAVLNTLEGDPRFFFDEARLLRPKAPEPRSGAAAAITGEAST